MSGPVAPPAQTFGEDSKKPPIILLHAFPLDGRIWIEQARALSANYKVIVPDLRGFGQAYQQLGGLSEIPIDLVAADIVQLLDDWRIERAIVGGISRGGYVALAFARHYPNRLGGLMLFDTRANPADQKEQHWATETVDRLASEGVECLPGIMNPRFFGESRSVRPELLDYVNAIMRSQKPDAVAAAVLGMASRPDQRPILSQIDVPALALAGTEDGAFANTKAIANEMVDAQFVAIPNAGHLPILEQPAAVNAAMLEFLHRLN